MFEICYFNRLFYKMESLGKYTTYMKQTICHVYLSLTNGVIIEIFMCIAGNINLCKLFEI